MPSIAAPKTYEPLDPIYSEEAFAWVLPRRQKDEFCDYCCKRAEDLIPCEKCSEVKYCGTECQEKNSEIHASECGILQKLEDEKVRDGDFVRLLARVIFLLKGKDWKEVKRDVMGTDVSFEDLESRYEELTTNPRLVLLCKEVKESLKHFIGGENLPQEESLIKFIGKVKYNSDSFKGSSLMFCFGSSFFEHECIPNANVESTENVLMIWAIRDINSGSEKISISRRSILDTNLFRSPNDEDTYEVCKCTECSSPYGETILTKVINEEKAYTTILWSERVLDQAQSLFRLDLEDDPKLKVLVDIALEKIHGVLADTHALHLKLLALRGQLHFDSKEAKREHLKKLETLVSDIFGEYSTELYLIYKALLWVNAELGDNTECEHYTKKITVSRGNVLRPKFVGSTDSHDTYQLWL